MVIGANVFGYFARVTQFAKRFFAIADGKRLDAVSTDLRRQGGNRAGIQPATEEHAQRHIAHQV